MVSRACAATHKNYSRILNLLGTEVKDVDNQKVELSNLSFYSLSNGTEWLKLICEALMKNLLVDEMLLTNWKLEVNYLAKMLSENSTVRNLHLFGNNMTDEGLDILANDLCKNSKLETLILFENDLGFKNESPSKFTGMAEMLVTNDKLEELNLSHNPLGSAGVTWIAEALESVFSTIRESRGLTNTTRRLRRRENGVAG